ncbi:MAG: hypothetical protein RIB58_13375 [Phycisphaerales bacterium]
MAPSFADAAPEAASESWAVVLSHPDVLASASAMTRRDTALGMPPAGMTRTAGAWLPAARPSLDRSVLIYLPRSDRSLLYFGTPGAHDERRAPRVPRRAYPWHTAW